MEKFSWGLAVREFNNPKKEKNVKWLSLEKEKQ